MSEHSGQLGDKACLLEVRGRELVLHLEGRAWGPRPLVGSLSHLTPDRFLLDMGTCRGEFTSADRDTFLAALADALSDGGRDPAAMFRDVARTASSISSAMESMRRMRKHWDAELERRGAARAAEDAGFDDLEAMARIHRLFTTHLAPRGWALSMSVMEEARVEKALDAVEKGECPSWPDEWDDQLSKCLLQGEGIERLVETVSRFPLRDVWRWSFVIGEAAGALRLGMVALAAPGFLIAAEGMWSDVQERVRGKRPKRTLFDRSSDVGLPVSLTLTWSLESLRIALDVLANPVRRSFLEPVDRAPASRHGLFHGRISGAIGLHHALKAFTVVEALVEQFRELRHVLCESEQEAPPWLR